MSQVDIYTKQNIYVVGYFGHANTGDENYLHTFEYVFQRYLFNFKNYNIIYLDCDHVKITTFIDSDIIILGGGDVLNNYFLDRIISTFINKPNKILAVSVGVPYTDILVNTNKLNIVDYIFVRTRQDLDLFKQHFHPHRILFIPDLSFFLLNILSSTKPTNLLIEENLQRIQSSGKKIIAITLSRHIHNKDFTDGYYKVLIGFSKLVKYLLTFDYHVVLLPFNTNHKHHSENDILIHNDLMTYFNPTLSQNITNITTSSSPLEVLSLYKYFYATVPMRFHATLFSIYTNTPMLPVFTTRKIKNLLLDIDWACGYELECNHKDIPTDIDDMILINRFRSMISGHTGLTTKLLETNRDIDLDNFKRLGELISCDYSKISFTLDTNTILTKAKNTFAKIQAIANKHDFVDFRRVTDPTIQKLIVQSTSYHLTNGTIQSRYSYGLSSKMFNDNFDYISEWTWVIRDNNKIQLQKSKQLFNNPYGLFNINYIDQVDYSGAHRSGWQYVYESIKYLHNDKSNLYLDLYLDRTFHWNKEINKELGLIPYKVDWIGFVHHTFDTSFSDYNNHNLLNNPDFIDSLHFCKGLFVLSKTLRVQFEQAFISANIHVPVFDIVHPTELTALPQFTYGKFLANNDKKLIHVGGWLRNIFSFYNLCIPKTYKFPVSKNFTVFNNTVTETIRKVALKGHSMDNYYPGIDFPKQLQKCLASIETNNNSPSQNTSQNTSQNSSQACCQNSSQACCQNTSQNCCKNIDIQNNWYKHFYEYTKYICDSVDFIEKLGNDDYDNLLTENIVFINLVDASAVNTIIECIVRNTPIVVNNHPAVVELLGVSYPLYFNSTNNYYEMNREISDLLSNTNNIRKAHTYIQGLGKSCFNIKYFTQQFITRIHEINKAQ